ncbi:MAG TPA: hypothetical protein VEV84_16485 [Pyrinomonadaceae bacterium]|jgi:hypothetical protein|nr:hypothetical protein [Pyrinomonadaceae bacterium]
MAYIKQTQGRDYPYLYNVNAAVGQRKAMYQSGGSGAFYTGTYLPNNRDDVMLVQYLLKRVYQRGGSMQLNPNAGSAWGSTQGSNITEINIDGLWGPKTQSAIEQFQLEVAHAGRSIATDGAVDKEEGNSPYSSISHTGYTISWLNRCFWLLYPDLAPHLWADPHCPAELRNSLICSTASAATA